MKNRNENKNEITFTMGLPAAGKSSVVANHFAGYNIIDPDEIKKASPLYTTWLNDRDAVPTLHDDSTDAAEVMFDNAVANKTGNYVVDGTGTNADKMVEKINRAKSAGFTVTVVWVKISLGNAIVRNAKRERTVPTYLLVEKAKVISTSYNIVMKYADNAIVIDNNKTTK